MAANLTYNSELEELRVVLLPQYASAILGPLAVANTLYVLLAGCCLFCSLSLWSTSWPRFSRYNKITFCLIVLLTLVQAGLSFEDLFFNSSSTAKAEAEVRRYTNVQAVQPFPGGAIMFLAQLFFLKRARYFLQQRFRWLTAVLYAGVVVGFGSVIIVTVTNFLSRYNVGNKAVYLIVANQVWFWSSMLTEAGIAATLAWRLWSYKGHTDPDGHPIELRVDNKVNRIVRCIVGSAAPTAVFAIVGAVTYMATRWTWYYCLCYIFLLPIPALETLSFLYALAGYPAFCEWAAAAPRAITLPAITPPPRSNDLSGSSNACSKDWTDSESGPEIVPALLNNDMRALANGGELPSVVWGESIQGNSAYAKA